jgi:hypothetical protein
VQGTITALVSNTSITVNATTATGGGPYTAWTFSIGGIPGNAGSAGASVGFRYTFSTTTTDGISTAQIRFNNSTIGSVTFLYINDVDFNSGDNSTWLSSLNANNGGRIAIKNGTNNRNIIFDVAGAPVDATTYYKIPVTYVSGALPSNGTALYLVDSRTGPTGPAGSAATISVGTVGSTGPTGTPTVTNSGTSSVAVFDFILQQGPTGPKGTYTVSTTAPTSPTPVTGDVWYNSETGKQFVYYDSYWVESTGAVAGPTGPVYPVTISTSGPTGGVNGDLWFRY